MRVWRIDRPSGGEVGWRTQYYVMGRQKVKLFSDHKYGGSEAAKKAAEIFATANITEHKELRNLNRRFEPRQNSQIGIPGVGRYTTKSGAAFWAASATHDGKKKMRKFSVAAHGEDYARQLAIECREQMVAEEKMRRSQLVEKYEPLFDPASIAERDELKTLNLRLEPRRDSPIGVPGVGRYMKKRGGPFWAAFATRDGKKCMRRFSVGVYGEEGARQLAIECRKQMVLKEIGRRAELVEKWDLAHADPGPCLLPDGSSCNNGDETSYAIQSSERADSQIGRKRRGATTAQSRRPRRKIDRVVI